ncbi:MAG: hypothetical protein IKY61_05290 [Thermoguttaceae bacterium]|nr:hypothetical protein [Thermoguttaceae bacterium]
MICAEPSDAARRASVWGVEHAESFRGVSRRALFWALTVRRRPASKRWGVERAESLRGVSRRALFFAEPPDDENVESRQSVWRAERFFGVALLGKARRVSVRGVERVESFRGVSRRVLFCAESPDDEDVESRQSVWRAEHSALIFLPNRPDRPASKRWGPQYFALIFSLNRRRPASKRLGRRTRRIVSRRFSSSVFLRGTVCRRSTSKRWGVKRAEAFRGASRRAFRIKFFRRIVRRRLAASVGGRTLFCV